MVLKRSDCLIQTDELERKTIRRFEAQRLFSGAGMQRSGKPACQIVTEFGAVNYRHDYMDSVTNAIVIRICNVAT